MQRFWKWYEKHYTLNLAIASGLFTLQLVHLFWLTTHVIWQRLFGVSLFNPSGLAEAIIILVDYTEIPALITTSLIYIGQLRKGFKVKPLLYLLFLNIQVIHIFWITDEFVVSSFTGASTGIPPVFAWVAILIDYLELPVIFETLKMLVAQLRKGDLKAAASAIKERD